MNVILKFLDEFRQLLGERQILLAEPANGLIGRYFFILNHENQKTNLTGYKTLSEYIDYHLLDTLKLAEIISLLPGSKILDVGTGCGVPGLLLQILFPQYQVTLMETTEKKIAFLEKTKRYIELERVTVIKGRAEELGLQQQWRESLDIVTARALGSFSTTMELTVPFVKVGGFCIYPRGIDGYPVRDKNVAALLGMEWKEEIEYALPGRDNRFRIVILEKVASTPEKYPRKPGQIQKRPL